MPFGDRAVTADELAGVVPLHVAGVGEQRLEVAADRRLALEALAPVVGALGVAELAILGEGIDDPVDVAAGEGVGDLGAGGPEVTSAAVLPSMAYPPVARPVCPSAHSVEIGTPGTCLAVRNTIMDFTWLTLGAEVSRVVRNF